MNRTHLPFFSLSLLLSIYVDVCFEYKRAVSVWQQYPWPMSDRAEIRRQFVNHVPLIAIVPQKMDQRAAQMEMYTIQRVK